MRYMIPIALALTGCASIPTPDQTADMTPQQLCDMHNAPPISGVADQLATLARAELGRRNLMTNAELSAVRNRSPQVGMDQLVLLCSWGRPSEVNRTAVAGGVSYQFVYERYLGRTTGSTYKFAYVRNGRIEAIQD